MTRSAAAFLGAALVVASCAATTTNEAVVAPDLDLFAPCAASVAATNCAGVGDDTARASCLDTRRAGYGRLHSAKMRRSWLIANGCPASTIDAPPKAAVAAAVVSPPPADKEVAVAAAPPAAIEATVAPPPTAPVSPPKVDAPSPAPAIATAPMPAPVASVTTDEGRPAGAFSDRDRADTRAQKLRDIISSHRPEMKSCVDRQLKLAPDLNAEGTLVIDVEKDGSVPSAELLGTNLAGTALEACLRTAAARWRFPASAHAYKISAPVKVWGSGRRR